MSRYRVTIETDVPLKFGKRWAVKGGPGTDEYDGIWYMDVLTCQKLPEPLTDREKLNQLRMLLTAKLKKQASDAIPLLSENDLAAQRAYAKALLASIGEGDD